MYPFKGQGSKPPEPLHVVARLRRECFRMGVKLLQFESSWFGTPGLLGKQCKYAYMHITTEVLSCINIRE